MRTKKGLPSVRYALTEGGADENLASEICATIASMGILPPDIPLM